MSDTTHVREQDSEVVFRQELFLPNGNEEFKKVELDSNGQIIRKNHSYFNGAWDVDGKKFIKKEKLEEPKGYISKSPIEGYGVFAKEDIKVGDLIEECPVVILDGTHAKNQDWVLNRYAFTWTCTCNICAVNGQSMCLPMGNGLVYNHSDTPNAYYIQDSHLKLFKFYALRNIKKDEEITWYYGHGYSQRLKKEKTLTPFNMIPENLPAGSHNGRIKKDCGCGRNAANSNTQNNEIKQEQNKEQILLTEQTPTVKNADELLFRSMIVPEKIINDQI